MTQTIQNWTHRGTLYAENNATAEPIVDNVPRKVTAFTDKGVESGVTLDLVNSQITINIAGDYMVTGGISFSGDSSDTYYVQIYKNLADTGLELERKMGTGGDVGNSNLAGLVTCVIGDDISLWQSSPSGGANMLITHAQLTVVRVG
jgi:hypothetical protein